MGEAKMEESQSMTLNIMTLGGSKHQVRAGPSWTVEQLHAELFEVLQLSESSTEMTTMALIFREVELESTAMLTACGLCDASEISVLVRRELRLTEAEIR